jgi:hypothetical protein
MDEKKFSKIFALLLGLGDDLEAKRWDRLHSFGFVQVSAGGE